MNVFYLPLDFDTSVEAEIYSVLCPARRARADACRVEADRRRSLGAGILLEYIRFTHHIDAPLTYSAEGKPSFEDAAPCFSLSHSGDYVMAASGETPIGCDLERIREIDAPSLARRFFSQNEQEAVLKSPSPRDTFFALWTQKEAVLKANGAGFKLAMPSFSVCGGTATVLDLSYTVDALDAPQGYRAALAYRGAKETHAIRYLSAREILQFLKEGENLNENRS